MWSVITTFEANTTFTQTITVIEDSGTATRLKPVITFLVKVKSTM